jgi:hypothetical protein
MSLARTLTRWWRTLAPKPKPSPATTDCEAGLWITPASIHHLNLKNSLPKPEPVRLRDTA